MKAVYLLAVLPVLGFFSGTSVVQYWGPLAFGMPTLLLWNLASMITSAAILSIIHTFDARDTDDSRGES
ncbi:DUF3311 domain-containing protein [Paraburkholderia heleia]|uniref:DUF3311 domain-containing protein n=1 Tax=Paraburkholderia heleia TaxID=634127 RepID=UPI0031DA79C5